MKKQHFNIFQGIPLVLHQEFIETLIEQPTFRLERIVSRGQVSPTGFWYDQDEHEWVIVLTGVAHLQIEGQEHAIILHPGDTYHLPPHTKHRVAWTATDEDTIWLALFWKDGEQ